MSCTTRSWALNSCSQFNPRLQFTEALAKGERFCVSLRSLAGPSANLHCAALLVTAQQLHCKKVQCLGSVPSASSRSLSQLPRNSNKSIMNFEEQPCSQLFCPHSRPACPTTSPALHPPLMCFQTHQIMIHWKRFLHLLRVFFLLLKLSEHFKGKQALPCSCCKRGKLHPRGKDGKAQAPGPWVGTSPRCRRQSMCLCS